MNLLLRLASVVCVGGWITARVNADLPCAPREIPGESVVCVCNETYCDEIEREQAPLGRYVSYTSSKGGLRFFKRTGKFFSAEKDPDCDAVLELYADAVYQCVEGFGGAITDASGLNWMALPRKMRKDLIYSYFGPKGLEYNMIRCPIGGCDFSTHPYTLLDQPRDDRNLINFALTDEDYELKLPMLRMALEASGGRAHVVATCWSPPAWMKSNENITGRSHLKEEYYQTYADYYLKFIESYTNQGVPIWGCTTTNEPWNGLSNSVKFNTLGWRSRPLAKWIASYLGPTLKNSEFDVKIMCSDDQRLTLYSYFTQVVEADPDVLKYIDGVAVHWYTNSITPPSMYNLVTKDHPDKFILATEACEGFRDNKVILGSWDRAMSYISDIITDLTYCVVGWIDWNLCLDPQGGPNWVANFVDSPVIVFKESKEFVKQPMFYAMGHFSKWVPRGSRRIDVAAEKPSGLELVAFRTPEENIVVILHNKSDGPLSAAIVLGAKETVISLEAYCVCTVEFPFSYSYFRVQRGYMRSRSVKTTTTTENPLLQMLRSLEL